MSNNEENVEGIIGEDLAHVFHARNRNTDIERNKGLLKSKKAERKLKASKTSDTKKRTLNLALLCWASFSTVANWVLAVLCWDNDLLTLIPYEMCDFGYPLCYAAWISSGFSVVCLLGYYLEVVAMDKRTWGFSSWCETLRNTSHVPVFFVELIILGVNPLPHSLDYPGTTPTATASRILQLVGFLRLYPIARAVRDHSVLYQERDTITAQPEKCLDNENDPLHNRCSMKPRHEVNTKNIMKTYFLKFQIRIIAAVYIVAIVLFSQMIYFMERPYWIASDMNSDPVGSLEGRNFFTEASDWYNPKIPDPDMWGKTDFDDVFTCFWLTVITMTSIGYGDISPYTTWGKIMAIIVGVVGIVNTSMIVSALCDAVANTSDFENFLRNWLRQKNLKSQMEGCSIKLIHEALKYNSWKKKHAKDANSDAMENKQNLYLHHISTIIKDMRSIRIREKEFTMAQAALEQLEVVKLRELREQLEKFKRTLQRYITSRVDAKRQYKMSNTEFKEKKLAAKALKALPSRNKRITFE